MKLLLRYVLIERETIENERGIETILTFSTTIGCSSLAMSSVHDEHFFTLCEHMKIGEYLSGEITLPDTQKQE